ncbi:MAG: GspH/FimT family protein [Desulfurivibrio sp.]|nr:GspH/FimT family protein [Desulfurivibrio sp.]
MTLFTYPYISSVIPDYELKGAVRELAIDFQKAKAEAVRRNRTVLLEFSPSTAVGEGSYIICVDENDTGSCATGDDILRRHHHAATGATDRNYLQ